MGAEENHGAGLEHTDTLGKHTDLQLGKTHTKTDHDTRLTKSGDGG